MNQPTIGVMDPQRRHRLQVTATREFACAGFQRASLNAIIRACGMSKSSFYHYFASKEALFDTVIAEATAGFATDLQVPVPASLAAADFWVRVEGIFQRLLALSASQPWYLDLGRLFHLADGPAGGSPALQRCMAQAAAWLDAALAAGRRVGAIRGDMPASLQGELVFAVLQAMDRWSLQHADDFDPDGQQQLLTQQLAALQRLLAP
jgi:AcrR family transcriptional regulator